MKMRYQQLVDDLADKIHTGALVAGTQLPTHRTLSRQYKISLATATRVYHALRDMGLVIGETGRGTFVKAQNPALSWGTEQMPMSTPTQNILDLNLSSPVLQQQSAMVRRALKTVLSAGDFDALLAYQSQIGRLSDRQQIAEYLSRLGISVNLDDLFLICGAQHGLCVTLMGLFHAGDVIAVDALTYPGFKLLALQLGIELLPIAANTSATALDLDLLEHHCLQRKIRAVYCMPTLHNPLGWVMSLEDRHKLVEIARKYDLILIEDAAYAYLVNHPPMTLAQLAPERTIYINGFSKNIAAGLRVGMLHCYSSARLPIQQAIRSTLWNTPAIMTAIVGALLEQGVIQKLELLKRKDAQHRQRIAMQIFQDFNIQAHPNSYFIWIQLNPSIRVEQVLQMLLEQQHILVSSAEAYAVGKYIPHAIRVSLSSIPIQDITHVLNLIKSVIEYHQDLN